MSIRKRFAALCVVASVVMAGTAALANQIPGATITGQLSTASQGDVLRVDGKMYRIKPGSPAAAAAPKLAKGEIVDAQLDGPANTSASEVINVVRHAGQ